MYGFPWTYTHKDDNACTALELARMYNVQQSITIAVGWSLAGMLSYPKSSPFKRTCNGYKNDWTTNVSDTDVPMSDVLLAD